MKARNLMENTADDSSGVVFSLSISIILQPFVVCRLSFVLSPLSFVPNLSTSGPQLPNQPMINITFTVQHQSLL